MRTKKAVSGLSEILTALAESIDTAVIDIAGQRITDPGFDIHHITRAIAKALKAKSDSLK